MNRDFEQKLREGQDGEREVGSFLLAKGMHLVPLYQYESHDAAPVLFSGRSRIILPDLDVYSDGRSFFVECKVKNQWVRFKGNVETGFDERHAQQYRRVQALTGKPVHLCFLHKVQPQTGLFRISLTRFFEKSRYWNGLNERTGQRVESPLRLVAFEHLEPVRDFVSSEAA